MSLPCPTPTVVATKLAGGEAVLLDLETASYVKLNKSAALIWSGLDSCKSSSEIVEDLTDTFGITEERAVASVKRFVGRLVDAGLVSYPPPRG